MSVTLPAKCYLSVCVGCGDLFQSNRKDKLTCSGACRVRAHRNDSVETLRKEASVLKVPPTLIQQVKAISILLPDEVPRIMAGEVEVDELQPSANQTFVRLIMSVLKEEAPE